MSDYAHNQMRRFRLIHELDLLIAEYHAELEVNAQEQADECMAKIESVREQISDCN